ncbi:hypothetical protein AHAS_Ahas15G0229700 [Arachis hypogaea]
MLEEVELKPIKLAKDVPNIEVGETMEIDEDEKEEEAKKHEELDPNIVQIFKNVEVTIPLFDAVHQVLKYAKFLKDVCTDKDKIGRLGMNPLANFVSSVMDDFPEKYSDPGPCLVSCMIGEIQLKDCMCDLWSCVSIMPLSIYKKLNLAMLRRSGARFVLADKSIISVVDTFSGDYSFEAKGKVVKFNLEETMRQPLEVHLIFGCDIVEDDVVEEHFRSDGEINVNRNLGIRGVSKENRKDPQLPYPHSLHEDFIDLGIG